MKGASLAYMWVKVSPIATFAAAKLNRNDLLLWAGETGWNAVLVLPDFEIGQMELAGIRRFSIDAGLNLGDLVLLQGLIDIRASIGPIGVEGLLALSL